MPRPKGSKNKSNQTIEQRIEALAAEIEGLKAQLAEKEAQLASLKNLQDEEKVKVLVDAIASKGRSIDDVIALINQEESEG